MKARVRIPNPNTTEHHIQGAQTDGFTITPKELTVRITSDASGKTLSISNEEDVMMLIPMEPILARLKEIL